MRAAVLKRSASNDRGQQRSIRPSRANTKRQRTFASLYHAGPASQAERLEQDQDAPFELPALAQLLQGIDQDDDDNDAIL